MEKKRKQISRGLRKRIRREKAVARSVATGDDAIAKELMKRLKHINPPLTLGGNNDKKESSE